MANQDQNDEIVVITPHLIGGKTDTRDIIPLQRRILLGKQLHLHGTGDLQLLRHPFALLFGCVFMCTDPVTTPLTPRGAWIFGVGVGVLVVLIRLFGGLPEAVMYSILLMNAFTPLINRLTPPRTFGG